MYTKKPFFGDVAFTYQIEDLIQSGHRPDIPSSCPSDYAALIRYIIITIKEERRRC